MAAETEGLKIKIAGVEYEIPDLDDLDMDEWQIVYDYSGLVLADFSPCVDRAEENIEAAVEEDRAAEAAGETKEQRTVRLMRRQKEIRDNDGPEEKARQRRVSQPSFTAALMHIGYRRAFPNTKPDEIKRIVGSTKRLDVLDALLAAVPDEGDADGPPPLTPEPEQSSQAESGSSSEEGSNDSLTSSEGQVVPLAPTGTDG